MLYFCGMREKCLKIVGTALLAVVMLGGFRFFVSWLLK